MESTRIVDINADDEKEPTDNAPLHKALNPLRRACSAILGGFMLSLFAIFAAARMEAASLVDGSDSEGIVGLLPSPTDALTAIGISAAVLIGISLGSANPDLLPSTPTAEKYRRKTERLTVMAVLLASLVASLAGSSAVIGALFNPDKSDFFLALVAAVASVAVSLLSEVGNAARLSRLALLEAANPRRVEVRRAQWSKAWNFTGQQVPREHNVFLWRIGRGLLRCIATYIAITLLLFIATGSRESFLDWNLIIRMGLPLVLFSPLLSYAYHEVVLTYRHTKSPFSEFNKEKPYSSAFLFFAIILLGFTACVTNSIALFSTDRLYGIGHGNAGLIFIAIWAVSWTVDFLWCHRLHNLDFRDCAPQSAEKRHYWRGDGRAMLRKSLAMHESDIRWRTELGQSLQELGHLQQPEPIAVPLSRPGEPSH